MKSQNITNQQSKWQRIILLTVLAYEGLGGLLGGLLLVTSPDGRFMDMPVSILNGSFPDFFIPGLILSGMGLLTTISFVMVFRKNNYDWLSAGLALVGYTIWFTVEIAILKQLHWLHIMWGVPVLIGIWAALPLIPKTFNIGYSSFRFKL